MNARCDGGHQSPMARSAPLTLLLVLAGCGPGIAVRRDLSHLPPGRVGYDDLCQLQDYFDALEIRRYGPPEVLSSFDLSSGRNSAGRVRLVFAAPFQRDELKRILAANYRALPPSWERAPRLEIEALWAEQASVLRLVTDRPATLFIDGVPHELPPHPCLSDLLFGEPLYRQRRLSLGLPLIGGGAAR